MRSRYAVMLSLFVGISAGAFAVSGLNAQSKGPGAYAIVEIDDVLDPETLKQLLPKAGPAATSAGGRFIARTENIIGVWGTVPKRFVIIAFDNLDTAKVWSATPAQKEVNDLAKKAIKGRIFAVEGM